MDHGNVDHFGQETIPETRYPTEKYRAEPAPGAESCAVDGRGYLESVRSRADPHSGCHLSPTANDFAGGETPGVLPPNVNPNATLPFNWTGCSFYSDPYALQAAYPPYSVARQPYDNINTFDNCNGMTGPFGQQGPMFPDPNVFPSGPHSQNSQEPALVPSALTEPVNPVAAQTVSDCNSNAALNASADVKNSTTNQLSGDSQTSGQSITFVAYDPFALPDSKRKRKQDEDNQSLSEIGGACIPCAHSRKKCDLEEVCTPCMGRQKLYLPCLPCLRGREGIWLYKEVIHTTQPEAGFRCLALPEAKKCSFPQVNPLLDRLEEDSLNSVPSVPLDHLTLLLQRSSRDEDEPYAVSIELLKRPPKDHVISETQRNAIITVARDVVSERRPTMQHTSGLMSPVVDMLALVGFLFSINNANLFLQSRLHFAARSALACLVVFTAQAIAQSSEEFTKRFLFKLRGKKTFEELVGKINLAAGLYYQILTDLSECRFCPMVEDIFSCIRGRLQPVRKTIAQLLEHLTQKYELSNPVSSLSAESCVPEKNLLNLVRVDLQLTFDCSEPSPHPTELSRQGQPFSHPYFLNVRGLLSPEGDVPILSLTDLVILEEDAGQDGETLGILDRSPITSASASLGPSVCRESEVPPSSDQHHKSNVQPAPDDTFDFQTEHPGNLGAPASSASQAHHDELYPAPPSLTRSGLGPSATYLQSSQWDYGADNELFQNFWLHPTDEKRESGIWGQQ